MTFGQSPQAALDQMIRQARYLRFLGPRPHERDPPKDRSPAASHVRPYVLNATNGNLTRIRHS